MSSHYKKVNISFWVTKKPYIAWIAATVFYFYQYVLRVSPGIMIDDIRSYFSLKAEDFATLGSIYLLCYALIQIPLGFIIDKVGARKVMLYCILTCIIGSFTASLSNHFFTMQLSRAITGFGSAAAFIIALKVIADKFAPGKRGLLMGATLTIGTSGALIAGIVISKLLNHFSWQHLWKFAALAGFIVFVLTFLFIPKQKIKIHKNISKPIKQDFLYETLEIVKDKNITAYAILAIGLYAPLAALADLWGVSFIKAKFHLSIEDATQIIMMLYLGSTIGSIVLPWVFERYSMLNFGISISAFLMLVIFSFILYGPQISLHTLSTLLFCMGLLCGTEMVCFASAMRYARRNNAGEVIGFINTLNMLGGALLQQTIGNLLDINWNGIMDEYGHRIYSFRDFTLPLSSITLILLVCLIISFVLDRRH